MRNPLFLSTADRRFEHASRIREAGKRLDARLLNLVRRSNQAFLPVAGDVINVMVNVLEGREFGMPSSNFKYDKLAKEHELLKEKLDKTVKELAQEREAKKTKAAAAVDNSKNEDLINREYRRLLHATLRVICDWSGTCETELDFWKCLDFWFWFLMINRYIVSSKVYVSGNVCGFV